MRHWITSFLFVETELEYEGATVGWQEPGRDQALSTGLPASAQSLNAPILKTWV